MLYPSLTEIESIFSEFECLDDVSDEILASIPRDVAKPSTLGGGVVMFSPTFPRILTKLVGGRGGEVKNIFRTNIGILQKKFSGLA